MYRQPLWHRLWKEFLSNREISAALNRSVSSDAYRVGLVGCGRVARRHLYGYVKTGKAQVVAASDPSSKQREKARKRFRIANTYVDFEEMFRRERFDMVSVCAPPRFHFPAVTTAAQAGVKVILCEKPIGLDLGEADEMIRVCRERGVMLAVGHQRRFGPQHQLAKKLLQDGAIGGIRHLEAECPRDILRAGIHCADMMLDYVGPISRVTASLSNGKGAATRAPQEACFSAESGDWESWILVEFANGLQGALNIEDRSPRDAKLIFLGDAGVLQVWWDGGLRYRRSQDRTWTVPSLDLNPYLEEFHLEIESVLTNFERKAPPLVRGEEGRNSLEVILAILIANQEGRSVSLPLPAVGTSSPRPETA